MKHVLIKVFIFQILLSACLSSQTVMHSYKLFVIDQDKRPLSGAMVVYEQLDQFATIKVDTALTDSTGEFTSRFPVSLRMSNREPKTAYSQLIYHIYRTGYFYERGRKYCQFGSSTGQVLDSVVTDTIAFEPLKTSLRCKFLIADFAGKPTKDPLIKLKISAGGRSFDTTVSANKTGEASIDIEVLGDEQLYRNRREYHSNLSYEISCSGYYPVNGELSTDYGSKYSSESNPRIERVRLRQPSDYLQPKFANSREGGALRKKILNFVDLIVLQSILSDAFLEYGSIELITFKKNKYLRIKLSSAITYNSLKLNNYDVGKRLFDEVIRKVLNPLNTFINNPNSFFGYDILLVGRVKDLSSETATPRSLEFRFLLPEVAVRSYKNKDISGQQLLDKSIILLDDERIELTLQ